MTCASPIELLSPAKNLECGIEAVLHGADAVYIGAPKFSARAAAGNSIDDIRRLCDFAHPFDVRIYVALNTILKDDELAEAERMIRDLYDAGIDALIIQDMGISRLDLPPLPLHASTQTDNSSVEKVDFLYKAGFSRAVLARELTLNEINTIHQAVPIELEAFVHGALCVSYSGHCYLSAALCNRSANRGKCAQFCRLPYLLTDADGKIIVADKHLLSLKDLNRSDELDNLIKAGVTSFKIEGRLKDMSYVKNITAYYRKRLDEIIARNPEYRRSSSGTSSFTFEPDPAKSFNRGFTAYYLNGRIADVTAFETPKSIGEPLGKVKDVRDNTFTLSVKANIHNGDGLIFEADNGEWTGVRVNRVENNRIHLLKDSKLQVGTMVFRNFDKEFEDAMARKSAERKLRVDMEWRDTDDGFALEARDETGVKSVIMRLFGKTLAQKEQTDNIVAQLSKLGNTPFVAGDIMISMSQQWFVPSSLLSEMRREIVSKLLAIKRMNYQHQQRNKPAANAVFPEKTVDYRANIANREAEQFYLEHGVKSAEKAFEIAPQKSVPLMVTKHCLRHSLGWCPVYHKKVSPYSEPFYLVRERTKLRLQFDCSECKMLIFRD
ncbi:MAG: U32 family peptidase [Tannerella sp.]|jgi:putative protease|nr:U32 family peptidase [Tannerella sp.]